MTGPVPNGETDAGFDTSAYRRFGQVTAVERTERGVLARLHGELLRVEVVRPDIVRIKISRGGVFDEAPTFAVCVDPLAEHVPFTVVEDEEMVQLHTSELVVSLWLAPFRLDVYRTDGTPVIRTSAVPARISKLLGIGDIGMRTMWQHWRAIKDLCRRGELSRGPRPVLLRPPVRGPGR